MLMSRISSARRSAWMLPLSLLVLCELGAQQSEFKGTFKEEMVEMRDGVKLATNVFAPEGPGPWPVVLTRTPYGKDRGGAVDKGGAVPGSDRTQAALYAARGYATVIQDCRGTGRSAGTQNFPYLTDGPDGYDTIEWIAKQPWSNGKIGMVGRSGYAITAMLAATQAPPHLLCAFTMLASGDARRVLLYMGGVYRKDVADGWMKFHGKEDQIAEIVARPISDPYWDWLDIVKQHPKIRIPIYNVGGWYDIFAQGMIDSFVGLQKNGRGHKIAVHVSSSNDPRFDPNPNTGKHLRLDSETRVAVNRVYHDAAHPSRILLPIVRIYEPEKPVANGRN